VNRWGAAHFEKKKGGGKVGGRKVENERALDLMAHCVKEKEEKTCLKKCLESIVVKRGKKGNQKERKKTRRERKRSLKGTRHS